MFSCWRNEMEMFYYNHDFNTFFETFRQLHIFRAAGFLRQSKVKVNEFSWLNENLFWGIIVSKHSSYRIIYVKDKYLLLRPI